MKGGRIKKTRNGVEKEGERIIKGGKKKEEKRRRKGGEKEEKRRGSG